MFRNLCRVSPIHHTTRRVNWDHPNSPAAHWSQYSGDCWWSWRMANPTSWLFSFRGHTQSSTTPISWRLCGSACPLYCRSRNYAGVEALYHLKSGNSSYDSARKPSDFAGMCYTSDLAPNACYCFKVYLCFGSNFSSVFCFLAASLLCWICRMPLGYRIPQTGWRLLTAWTAPAPNCCRF